MAALVKEISVAVPSEAAIGQAALGVICKRRLLDGRRRGFGEAFDPHIAVLRLPFVILLHEDGAGQALDGVVIGESMSPRSLPPRRCFVPGDWRAGISVCRGIAYITERLACI